MQKRFSLNDIPPGQAPINRKSLIHKPRRPGSKPPTNNPVLARKSFATEPTVAAASADTPKAKEAENVNHNITPGKISSDFKSRLEQVTSTPQTNRKLKLTRPAQQSMYREIPTSMSINNSDDTTPLMIDYNTINNDEDECCSFCSCC